MTVNSVRIWTCQERCVELAKAYLSKRLVYYIKVLEVVVGEEIELVEEITDVYAAQRIHLREGQDTWEPAEMLVLGLDLFCVGHTQARQQTCRV